jgi:hypothetical protein
MHSLNMRSFAWLQNHQKLSKVTFKTHKNAIKSTSNSTPPLRLRHSFHLPFKVHSPTKPKSSQTYASKREVRCLCRVNSNRWSTIVGVEQNDCVVHHAFVFDCCDDFANTFVQHRDHRWEKREKNHRQKTQKSIDLRFSSTVNHFENPIDIHLQEFSCRDLRCSQTS